jgi:hypothetical protein
VPIRNSISSSNSADSGDGGGLLKNVRGSESVGMSEPQPPDHPQKTGRFASLRSRTSATRLPARMARIVLRSSRSEHKGDSLSCDRASPFQPSARRPGGDHRPCLRQCAWVAGTTMRRRTHNPCSNLVRVATRRFAPTRRRRWRPTSRAPCQPRYPSESECLPRFWSHPPPCPRRE